LDEEMLQALTRLVKCLRTTTEAEILGPGIVREILYRALCGTQAPVLQALATYNGTFSQIARAIKIMQNDYANKLDVEQLADSAHLSISAFHRAFKEVTSDSPMQYLKKIRLTKAKDFMMQENIKAYLAADKVGYESPSQFSREFKRYFGQTPAEMMREFRTA
jgi:transcriptional regulator GlxA family with amidase domain